MFDAVSIYMPKGLPIDDFSLEGKSEQNFAVFSFFWELD